MVQRCAGKVADICSQVHEIEPEDEMEDLEINRTRPSQCTDHNKKNRSGLDTC